MKKTLCFVIVILCLTTAVFAQIAKGGTAWVSVKSIALKSSSGVFASSLGTVVYGDQVTVLQVSGSWAEVRSAANTGLSGWISTANLSAKRIVVSGSTSSASASEVALAGKGFNQEVENQYKTEGNLNYAAVDWTENITISDDDLLRFINEGGLAAGGN
ncbi:MAG: SH3 domain-containing protein [Treponema sp.]|nr:SH3 domain-containing protein [Treponema sp.]